MKLIKLEFPGGRGAKQKTFCGGGGGEYGYFLELYIILSMQC